KDDLGALLQFIRSQNNLTNIEELLNRNVDVLGGDFKVRLTSKFPNLTTSELQLIIYLRLGLPTKEIAQIKNVEPSSVRIFKHRLKTKLGISKEVDLVRFIGEL
ncbi:MAG: LuxR C-terminal-related transcriptional regulator, partial [Crocinitomicaceae bacterium]|nr:LuxR C-terminal-related transcriptional regulator [Crocinitomicaceae bacterium]